MVWSGVNTGELCDITLSSLCAVMQRAAKKNARLQRVAGLLHEATKLDDLSRIQRWLTNTRAVVCRKHLEKAIELMRCRRHPLATTLAPMLRRLNWVAGEGDLRTTTASADIFVTQELQIGVTLTAPHTRVPLHVTRADEVCLPLSDTMWEQNLQTLQHPLLDREQHDVGSVRIWEAAEPHGLVTAEDPLLLVWMRYGDFRDGVPILFVGSKIERTSLQLTAPIEFERIRNISSLPKLP